MAKDGRPSAARRGYGEAWRKARLGFLASHPKCATCAQPATVVNHKRPHKGDQAVFWDRSNWQPLCKSCHDRVTAARDGGFGNPVRTDGEAMPARRGVDALGWPLDPGHPWRRGAG